MRTKSRRVLGMILAIFVSCLGICFDFVRTDSFPACMADLTGNVAFASCDVQRASSQGLSLSVSTEIEEVHLCTAEMLGVYCDANVQRVTGRLMASGQQIRHVCGPAAVHSFATEPGRFYAGNEVLQVSHSYQDERIVQYILNSDGKKKI